MSFVFDLPLWIVGVALVAILCGVAALGLVFARRRILPRFQIIEGDGHFTGTLVHSIMVFYALTVAMIAITVWETYDTAAKIASGEATAIAGLYRDVSAYPPPVGGQLQGALREYTQYVLEKAWPEQRRGRVPRGGVDLTDRFQEILTDFEPRPRGRKSCTPRRCVPTTTWSKRAGCGSTRFRPPCRD